jgi:hypothetical protein
MTPFDDPHGPGFCPMPRKPALSLSQVIWDDEALSVLRTDDGFNIVRPTTDGRFAVIRVHGFPREVVKVLPTLARAQAYNFAISE